MKKLILINSLIIALLAIAATACKNPVEDVKIVVDMNIMKYSVLVHISDETGAVPQNISLTVGGNACNDIYEISGKKNFTVKDGVITLGLNPSVTPTTGKDVSFNISISATGYKSTVQSISFTSGTMQQVVNIIMEKPVSATAPVTTPVTTPVATPVTTPTTSPATTPTTTTVASSITVSLDFTGYCANRTNLQIRPSLYVFYREKGMGTAYKYLGYIKDGGIKTDKLSMGKTYEFQITYAGENYTISQLINQTSYTETFNMGSSVCSTF